MWCREVVWKQPVDIDMRVSYSLNMDKDLARAFKLARQLIADDQHWYICEALRELYMQKQLAGLEYERARNLITQRLGFDKLGYMVPGVEHWLRIHVPGFCDWRPGTKEYDLTLKQLS